MCLKKDEVFEDIDRNEIVKIIKRKANKRVIEGGCERWVWQKRNRRL